MCACANSMRRWWEGIRKRDPDQAEKAIREHIEAFRENIVRQF
jgi:DNA-binding FadR family transcriptional regulator